MDETLEMLSFLEEGPMESEAQPPINPEYEFLAGMISEANKYFNSESLHEQESRALKENISSLKDVLHDTQQNLERERELRLQTEEKLRTQLELNESLNDLLVNTRLQEDQSAALVEEQFMEKSKDLIKLLQDVSTAYLIQFHFLRRRRVFKYKFRTSWPILNNKIAACDFLKKIYADHEERELLNPGPELRDYGVNCNMNPEMRNAETTTDEAPTVVEAQPKQMAEMGVNTDEVVTLVEKPKQMVETGVNTVSPNRVTRSTQITENRPKLTDRSTMCSILDIPPPPSPPQEEEVSMDLDEIFRTTICQLPAILDEIEELVLPKVSTSCQTDTSDLGGNVVATGSAATLTDLFNVSRSIDYSKPRKRCREDPEMVKRELSMERDLLGRPGAEGISSQFEQYWTMAGRSLLAMLEAKPKNEALEVDIFTSALIHQQMVAKILNDAPVRRAVSIPSVYAESTKSGYEKDAADDDDRMDLPTENEFRGNSEDSLEAPRSFRSISEDFRNGSVITMANSTEFRPVSPLNHPEISCPRQATPKLTGNGSSQHNSSPRKAQRRLAINRTVQRILRDRTMSYKLRPPMEKIQIRIPPKPIVPAKRRRVEMRHPDRTKRETSGTDSKSINHLLFGSNSASEEEEENGPTERDTKSRPTSQSKSIERKRKSLNAEIFGSDSEVEEDERNGAVKCHSSVLNEINGCQKKAMEPTNDETQQEDEPKTIIPERNLIEDLRFSSDSESEADGGKSSVDEIIIDPPPPVLSNESQIPDPVPEFSSQIHLRFDEELPMDFDSPKSPPQFDCFGSDDPPKDIPSETLIRLNETGVMRELKLTHTTINQFLQNYSANPEKPCGRRDKRKSLITNIIDAYLDREWTSASVDECVNSLRDVMKDDPTTNLLLVKCMLSIIADSKDDLHFEPFNCLAPFMPQTHQMVVLLVSRFDLGQLMLAEIERCLFTLSSSTQVTTVHIINWTYLYLSLQDLEINKRQPGGKVPLRLFLAKAFYYLKYTSVLIVYMTLKAFPKLLPRNLENRPFVLGQGKDPLVDVLICLLMNPIKVISKRDTSNRANEIRNDLQKLLNTYYRYRPFQIKPQEAVDMLMERLRTPGRRDFNVVHGFLILAKHFNSEWAMSELLQKDLLPRTETLMNSGEEPLSPEAEQELCLCLTVIAGVVKVFPRESNVSSYRELFRAVLQDQRKYSHRLQECAVISIIRLCAFGTDESFKAIRNWYAPVEAISLHLRAVLESFVSRRKPRYWIELSNGAE